MNDRLALIITLTYMTAIVLVIAADAFIVGDALAYAFNNGHVIAHPDTRQFVPGAHLGSASPIVSRVVALPKGLRTTETVPRFSAAEKGKTSEMIGEGRTGRVRTVVYPNKTQNSGH